MRQIPVLILLTVLSATYALAQSPLDQVWRTATKSRNRPTAAALSDDKITAGLKEALKVSIGKAVASTGRGDGFLKNEAIKILLPEKLRTAGRGMRLLGMGPELDELEVGMNRAAEQATPLAKQIFLNALLKMNIDDARNILTGGDNTATELGRTDNGFQTHRSSSHATSRRDQAVPPVDAELCHSIFARGARP